VGLVNVRVDKASVEKRASYIVLLDLDAERTNRR